MSQPVAHSVDSRIAEVVLIQLGHKTQRHEDRHFPDRRFTLQRPAHFSALARAAYTRAYSQRRT